MQVVASCIASTHQAHPDLASQQGFPSCGSQAFFAPLLFYTSMSAVHCKVYCSVLRAGLRLATSDLLRRPYETEIRHTEAKLGTTYRRETAMDLYRRNTFVPFWHAVPFLERRSILGICSLTFMFVGRRFLLEL